MSRKAKKSSPKKGYEFEEEVKKILRSAGFGKVDREYIRREIDGKKHVENELDISAEFSPGKKVLFSCKTSADVKVVDEVEKYSTIKRRNKQFSAVVFILKNKRLRKIEEDIANEESIYIWRPKDLGRIKEMTKYFEKRTYLYILAGLGILEEEDEKIITVPAIKVVQPGGTFYVTKLDPEILLDMCYVRSKDLFQDETGFQRIAKSKRLERIGKYLDESSSIIPNSVLISSMEEDFLDFKRRKNKLQIKTKPLSFSIIDGQHRIFGFLKRKNKKRKYPLTTIIFDNLGVGRQAKIFKTINEEQRKISKHLILSLFKFGDPKTREYHVHYIIDKLSTDSTSPWHNQIDVSGQGDDKTRPLKNTTINTALDKLLRNKRIFDYIVFKKHRPDFLYKIIRNYSRALRKAMSSEWVESIESRKDVPEFMKSNGILVLYYNLLEEILISIREDIEKKGFGTSEEFKEVHYTEAKFFPIIKGLKKFNWEKHKGRSGGFSTAKEIYLDLRKKIGLKEKIKSLEEKQEWGSMTEIIRKGEGKTIEFKSSLGWDFNLKKANKERHLDVLKTIAAFLNTQGGTLLIGINDKARVLGLKEDFKILGKKKGRDGFELKLMSLFGDHIGNEHSGKIKVLFEEYRKNVVCRINVDKSNSAVYLGSEKDFYIRRGNSSVPLNTQEAADYIKENFD